MESVIPLTPKLLSDIFAFLKKNPLTFSDTSSSWVMRYSCTVFHVLSLFHQTCPSSESSTIVLQFRAKLGLLWWGQALGDCLYSCSFSGGPKLQLLMAPGLLMGCFVLSLQWVRVLLSDFSD